MKTLVGIALTATVLVAQPAPPSEWDISGSGDPSIQGFTTDISANVGETVRFKINSTASYRLDIYRMGYYGGNGASKIATIGPFTGVSQPSCLTNSASGLVDCGNWSITANWAIPSNAKSGIYFAKAVKTSGTAGASHIVFVVRDDSSHSDILFQTSDTTWQAYNRYGGNSLYTGAPAGRAYKVSYNRPFTTRAYAPEDWVFSGEYPMVRWLEANGYDVSYTTGIDTHRRGNLITNHKVFLSVGHDEYWSAAQRANVEAARAAGVHLGFFSGNEVFWKTRWENSISASPDSYRTLVCYKETHAGAKIDPTSAWTGTWRDPRFSPPADGGKPENALTGTIFTVNCCTNGIQMKVNAEQGKMRFWRNTNLANLAPGTTANFGNTGILNYEWDEDLDNGFRPPGLIRLSHTPASGLSYIQDHGSNYGSGSATHTFTLYRHSSGALVFGAGTVQYAWGLDANHDGGSFSVDPRMQQATVNLLADMGAQPLTLQPGLIPSAASTDTSRPLSTITSPAAGSAIPMAQTTISGTASDVAGVVAAVEVSIDGGTTWRPATGTTNWTFQWRPTAMGPVTILSRAIDDSGLMQNPPTSVSVTVNAAVCPCTMFGSAAPATPQSTDTGAVELGVKFRSSAAGYITAIRFYKGAGNTGTHSGRIWSAAGASIANVTFTGETASGWQQMNFPAPVPINANTTYVASYHAPNGRYAINDSYFATSGSGTAPLSALANGVDGGNGVYQYGSAGQFPTNSWNSSNYWVDVVFTQTLGADTTPPVISSVAAAPASTTATITWTTNEPSNSRVAYGTSPGSLTLQEINAANVTSHSISLSGLTPGTTYYYRVTSIDAAGNSSTSPVTASAPLTFSTTAVDTTAPVISAVSAAPGGTTAAITWTTNEASNSTVLYGTQPASLNLNAANAVQTTTHTVNLSGLTTNTTYYYRVVSADAAGNSATEPVQASNPLSFTTSATSTVTIFADSDVPAVPANTDPTAVEVGVKFRSATAGYITGIRFYKGTGNTGTHIGSLWSNTGLRLANVTFVNETASGWQRAEFTSPVSINANTTYIASYHAPVGRYAINENFFASSGVSNPPLTALASGVDGQNGVYTYGPAGSFPSSSFNSANYWVDVLYTNSLGPDTTPPVISSITANPGLTSATVSWTTNEASNSLVQYGTSAGSLTLSSSNGSNVTAHTVVLSGLSPGTTYHFRVTSSDAAGNSATSPILSSAPLSFTTTAADTTPPVISAVTATPGNTTATVVWTTNEGSNSRIDYGTTAASLSSTATDASFVTSHSLNLTGLTAGVTYYYRVISVDSAGNSTTFPAVASAPSTFTTTAPGSNVLTKIFPDAATPAILEDSDTVAVELGMAFRSDVAGQVTAIRFYKGLNNTGLHVGKIWSAAGAVLASVTFSNETASGWQQANLTAPLTITAGTTYVVSYHAPNGHYSADSNFFSTSGVYNGPLYALRTGVSGANGLYRYGASAFPNQSYSASNYWVDVVLSTPAGPVRRFPDSTTIVTGTLRGGSAAQLAADDNAYYELNSTTSGTRTTAWYASFNGVPRTVQSIRVAYVGKNSRSCTEVLSVWNWTTSAWVQLNSTAVTTNELLRSNLSPSGALSNYVSGTSATGEVRVLSSCTTTANFNSSADVMSLTYAP